MHRKFGACQKWEPVRLAEKWFGEFFLSFSFKARNYYPGYHTGPDFSNWKVISIFLASISQLTRKLCCRNVCEAFFSLWTAMLWKSHENVIKNPGKHFSGPWIQIFHFHGLFFRPWIFYEKLIMVFMAHEIAWNIWH